MLYNMVMSVTLGFMHFAFIKQSEDFLKFFKNLHSV